MEQSAGQTHGTGSPGSSAGQTPIIRHYRAATRADVEQAYRAEAAQAAEAGYLPVTHQWTTDWQGFLLAVTYRQSSSGARPMAQAAPAPVAGSPATAVAPQAMLPDTHVTAPVDEFARSQPASEHDAYGGFAPPGGAGSSAAEQWLEPAEDQPLAEWPRVDRQAAVSPPAAPDAAFQPEAQQPAYDPYGQLATAPTVTPRTEAPEDLTPAPVVAAADVVETPAAIHAPAVAERATTGPSRQARLTVQTLDLHTAGEPLRIIRSGFPDVPHLPVLERRQWVRDNADHVRKAIINEPRGHRDMYGAILLPPYSDYADMTVLFMHNEGYSTMCGHGIIAITTGLIEEGLYPATEPVTTIRYEVPAGIVAANAATVQLDNGNWAVRGVRFTNVPSYVAAQSLAVRPEGVQLFGSAAQYGALSVDLAFGGAYYGIVNAAELGLRVVPDQADELRRVGAAITDVLRRDHTPAHPLDADLSFVYGTIIVDLDPKSSPDGLATRAHMRNATIFADAELDRSPCGSGTSAILAQLHARGRIKVGQEIINAGITGEHFLGRVEAETSLGPYPAVSTSIAGTAYVTGFSTLMVDTRDPLGEGFLLR